MQRKKEGKSTPLICGDHRSVVVHTSENLTITWPTVMRDNCIDSHTRRASQADVYKIDSLLREKGGLGKVSE